MAGTGRRWWAIGAGVAVVCAAVVGWAIARDGGEDDGSDTTPPPELTWVQRLAELGGAEPGAGAASIGTAVGRVVVELSTPQDPDAFAAEHGIGPADMASQLATALAGTQGDVSPPSDCGVRSRSMSTDDTRFVLDLATSAVLAIERDQDPAAVAALILPTELEGDQREVVAAALAVGDVERAADIVQHELGDDAARRVVHGLAEEVTGVIDAEYVSSFLDTYRFAIGVDTTGCD